MKYTHLDVTEHRDSGAVVKYSIEKVVTVQDGRLVTVLRSHYELIRRNGDWVLDGYTIVSNLAEALRILKEDTA